VSAIALKRPGLSLSFDDRAVAKRVGLVVLATDHTSERDFRRMVESDRVGVYVARVAYENPTTPENLRRMQPRLAEAAGLILPGEDLDAICYSCTSASVVMGDEAVEQAVASAKPGIPVVTPPAAARRALGSLGARRVSVLTPYTEETGRPMAAYFERHGFDLAGFTCLGLDDDREMARISPASLVAAAREAVEEDAEALFISCTALRSAEAVVEIERATGLPVVTSNLATAWLCLGFCEEGYPRPGLGRLMEVAAPAAPEPAGAVP
jgi:maleate isomerase